MAAAKDVDTLASFPFFSLPLPSLYTSLSRLCPVTPQLSIYSPICPHSSPSPRPHLIRISPSLSTPLVLPIPPFLFAQSQFDLIKYVWALPALLLLCSVVVAAVDFARGGIELTNHRGVANTTPAVQGSTFFALSLLASTYSHPRHSFLATTAPCSRHSSRTAEPTSCGLTSCPSPSSQRSTTSPSQPSPSPPPPRFPPTLSKPPNTPS